MEQQSVVVIVGAGPAGIAISACLNVQQIPNIVLEKENCCAILWREKSYDRLKLHLAKEFCALPHMPFDPDTPTFLSKKEFVRYVDNYVAHFNVNPLYRRMVESSSYNEDEGMWRIVAKNMQIEATETYKAKFLVVAAGENGEAFIPAIDGLDRFTGKVLHSSQYTNGKPFEGKSVLVVGSGNSGMEIACDLSEFNADSSIVIRSPLHALTREMVQLGMNLLKFRPVSSVDKMMNVLSMNRFGDLSSYGLRRPENGPFYIKKTTGRSPVIDVGTFDKIRAGEIKVFPSIKKVDENGVEFVNGETKQFDAIVLATGYKSTVRKWLRVDDGLFGENGMPKERSPKHWKGEKGIYSVGFARAGLKGISQDAINIADDISSILNKPKGA